MNFSAPVVDALTGNIVVKSVNTRSVEFFSPFHYLYPPLQYTPLIFARSAKVLGYFLREKGDSEYTLPLINSENRPKGGISSERV